MFHCSQINFAANFYNHTNIKNIATIKRSQKRKIKTNLNHYLINISTTLEQDKLSDDGLSNNMDLQHHT